MTGTPIQNNLSELWALLHFCMPLVFGPLDQFISTFKDTGDLTFVVGGQKETTLFLNSLVCCIAIYRSWKHEKKWTF